MNSKHSFSYRNIPKLVSTCLKKNTERSKESQTELPKELKPHLFLLTGMTREGIITRLLIVYGIVAFLCASVCSYLWQVDIRSFGVITLIKLLSISANPLSLYFLVLSVLVDRYDEETYVRKYLKNAHTVKGWEQKGDDELNLILLNLFGHAKTRIKSTLDSNVGILLLASSTTLAFLTDLLEKP